MRIALIADVFPPLRSSGAVQLRDLSIEFVRQGHALTVMIPSHEIADPWHRECWNGIDILKLKAPRTKDVGLVRRTVGELMMPFAMMYHLRASPLVTERWDGVLWYSPTIFLGPMAKSLKRQSACRGYLIIRDIFPEWAADVGLMSHGPAYAFFKAVARFQYSAADVIGVQTTANLANFRDWARRAGRRVEVLHNWLLEAPDTGCGISIADGPLAGRKMFVYAGNMGAAQGMDILLELARRLQHRTDLGFLFVGRGSEARRLRETAIADGLDNVVFHDEIDPLYAQCHVGLVALDPRHRTHNIPGKFLTYMQAGVPVLASINPGNDLEKLITDQRVGRVCSNWSVETLACLARELLDEVAGDDGLEQRCKGLAASMFSAEAAVRQIVGALAA